LATTHSSIYCSIIIDCGGEPHSISRYRWRCSRHSFSVQTAISEVTENPIYRANARHFEKLIEQRNGVKMAADIPEEAFSAKTSASPIVPAEMETNYLRRFFVS
jgi:hypothetical protein